MFLPEYIQTCIRMLEEAGFAAYAVGGCVRDALLGLEPHDYDLCTDARPDGIRRVFAGFRQILAGEKHGTVTVLVMSGMTDVMSKIYEVFGTAALENTFLLFTFLSALCLCLLLMKR